MPSGGNRIPQLIDNQARIFQTINNIYILLFLNNSKNIKFTQPFIFRYVDRISIVKCKIL
jgi:hypothetical protein